ncbi:MAG: DUF1036 domain-containing protein [Pseudomonadota bacterium]
MQSLQSARDALSAKIQNDLEVAYRVWDLASGDFSAAYPSDFSSTFSSSFERKLTPIAAQKVGQLTAFRAYTVSRHIKDEIALNYISEQVEQQYSHQSKTATVKERAQLLSQIKAYGFLPSTPLEVYTVANTEGAPGLTSSTIYASLISGKIDGPGQVFAFSNAASEGAIEIDVVFKSLAQDDLSLSPSPAVFLNAGAVRSARCDFVSQRSTKSQRKIGTKPVPNPAIDNLQNRIEQYQRQLVDIDADLPRLQTELSIAANDLQSQRSQNDVQQAEINQLRQQAASSGSMTSVLLSSALSVDRSYERELEDRVEDLQYDIRSMQSSRSTAQRNMSNARIDLARTPATVREPVYQDYQIGHREYSCSATTDFTFNEVSGLSFGEELALTRTLQSRFRIGNEPDPNDKNPNYARERFSTQSEMDAFKSSVASPFPNQSELMLGQMLGFEHEQEASDVYQFKLCNLSSKQISSVIGWSPMDQNVRKVSGWYNVDPGSCSGLFQSHVPEFFAYGKFNSISWSGKDSDDTITMCTVSSAFNYSGERDCRSGETPAKAIKYSTANASGVYTARFVD